jgi:glycosyltransferase involved in cell wall biosynthesis
MRILLLTQIPPFPPDSGPKIKTYHVLRYLAEKHRVHLVSFVRSAAEEAHVQALAPLCSGVTTVAIRRSRVRDFAYLVRSLITGRPFLIERDDQPAMRRVVARLLADEPFDAVHADQLSMAQFAIDASVPLRVLDEHNAVWTIVRRSAEGLPWPLRLVAAVEWRKLRSYEGLVCRRFDCVTVVSEDDRLALRLAAGKEFASVTVPIAVDTASLRFLDRGAEARHVVSVATMFYPPNVEGVRWFSEQAFPRVRELVPGTQFFVVGSRPPQSLRALGAADQGIIVTGYVADLDPILRQSGALVVPVHSGSGMRVKILEAFARGIPIVSTSIGVEGIAAQHDVHLMIADDPMEFAQSVARLLCEPETAARVARAGRDLVESHYDWRTALVRLDEVYPPTGVAGSTEAVGSRP